LDEDKDELDVLLIRNKGTKQLEFVWYSVLKKIAKGVTWWRGAAAVVLKLMFIMIALR